VFSSSCEFISHMRKALSIEALLFHLNFACIFRNSRFFSFLQTSAMINMATTFEISLFCFRLNAPQRHLTTAAWRYLFAASLFLTRTVVCSDVRLNLVLRRMFWSPVGKLPGTPPASKRPNTCFLLTSNDACPRTRTAAAFAWLATSPSER